jgi:hypothetical protein
VVHVAPNQFVFDGPFEAPAYPANRLVDVAATPAFIDHPLTHCFERQGAKIVGDLASIQFSDDLQSFYDAAVFARDPTVFAVVVLSELPIGIEDFDHGGVGFGLQSAAIGKELGNDAVVFRPAGG